MTRATFKVNGPRIKWYIKLIFDLDQDRLLDSDYFHAENQQTELRINELKIARRETSQFQVIIKESLNEIMN